MQRVRLPTCLVVAIAVAGCSKNANDDASGTNPARVDAGHAGSGGTSSAGKDDASSAGSGGTSDGAGGTPAGPVDAGHSRDASAPGFSCGPLQCSDASPCPRFQWPAPICDQFALGHGYGTVLTIGCGYTAVLVGSHLNYFQEVYDQSGQLVARRGNFGGRITCEDARPDVRSATTSAAVITLDCPGVRTCATCPLGSGPPNSYWCTSEDGGSFSWVPPGFPPDAGAP